MKKSTVNGDGDNGGLGKLFFVEREKVKVDAHLLLA